jgi:hypothetical protein
MTKPAEAAAAANAMRGARAEYRPSLCVFFRKDG